ncbi:hypothetical protein SRCM100623_00242 [Acetobacter pasteurianus]|uniref:Uncharacterized protein n=1 Tax=Acetobacter pasteurianus TaxID=438 RepID=A0A1A0DMC2_ACEPA|nr:hypothetical protein SRCM100623_00242 [Acetobacter pasteurianus]
MMTFRKISAGCRGQVISDYYLQDIPDPDTLSKWTRLHERANAPAVSELPDQ